MIRHLILLVFLIATCSDMYASIVYVKSGAVGTGRSWDDALGDLQIALSIVKAGDSIWVTKGTYYPTGDTNRTISFEIKSGIAVYGGFAGHEKSIEERIIKANPSVLSGNIGTKQKTDNTHNVLYIKGASTTTIIDGFTITGGYADGDESLGSRFTAGGGVYNDAASRVSSPIFRNCQFIDNWARDGGAIYNHAAQKGYCKPIISKCEFIDNKAFLGGGAIFNSGSRQGECEVTIVDSRFYNNKAGFGGAIFNYGKDGISKVVIENTVFQVNSAVIQGGGIFNLNVDGVGKSSFKNCEFINNSSPQGSTVANSSLSQKPKNTSRI